MNPFTILLAALALVVSGCALPTSAASTPAGGGLDALDVREEDTGAHYDRDAWGDWTVDGNGCDTRERILQAQGTAVEVGKGCKVLSGTWLSVYDGKTITSARGLDIDHIVPLSEAQQSGARGWSKTQRVAFYNDAANLVAVSASSNRSKGDDDPAEWMPTATYRCAYATAYVAVKAKTGLSVDRAERDALAGALRGC